MSIKINFLTQFDNRGIKQAQREISAVGRNIGRALDVAVIGGLAAATTGLVSAVKAASNYAAEFEGVNQVFGDAAKSVQAFADTAAKTAGLSATEALQSAKVFGLFAKSAGLSGESAADFSTTLVQLAGDLGSFNDVPTAEALAAIQSGLQGQAEPLRKFGVFLTDDALKAEYLAQTGQKVVGSLTAQQKMMASYGLIMKQTTIQQGDFTKYGDTMGNSLKTLTKTFEDLSAQIGQQLVPVIEQVLPTLQEMIPVIGQQLKDAVASVDWKAFADAMIGAFTFIIDNAQTIATFVITAWSMSKAFTAIKLALDVATISMAVFNGTLAVSPVGLALIAIAGLIGGLVLLKTELDKVDWSTKQVSGSFNQLKEDAKTDPFASLTASSLGYGIALDGVISKQAQVSSFSKPATGASTIENYRLDQVAAKSKATPKIPVIKFPEIKGASKAEKEADKAKAALKKLKDALKAFKTDLKGLTGGLEPLTQASTDLGRFEQSVVDTFDGINKKIAEGIANKTIGTKGLAELRKTLASYNDLLLKNAQQRDAIIKKRSLAEALIADVKSSLTGTGNLANLLDTQTKQVTTSVTKIVDGFSVTTKRTVDEVIGAKGVVGRLKEVVAKTKAFATQLKDLKAAGLSPDLFKQIVDAGPDVGGQLATEILAGGKDSVKALNDTFKELETVSAAVAEQTAIVMYNNGVEVAGGLVKGLLAQEAALVAAAKTLADAFNAAYQAQVMDLSVVVPQAPTVVPKTPSKTTNVYVKNTIKASPATKKDAQKAIGLINKYSGANGYGLLDARRI